MKITTKILVACLPGIVAGALLAASTGDQRAASQPNDAAVSKVKSSLGKLPLSFEPNRGQTDPQVQFLSRGPGYNVFFTKDGTVLSMRDTKTSNAVVRMRFVGGSGQATAQPVDALPGVSNYLRGSDPSKWQTNVPEYSKLRFEGVYPGIDVLYQGEKQKSLRYDFVVRAGADPSLIQIAYDGPEKVAVNKDGDLEITLDGKTLVTGKPFTYQEENGTKKEVASRFVASNGRVSFELGKYDTSKDLVIDPQINFVTFLGGLLNDSVSGVAIANPTLTISSAPSAFFLTGTTNSANFPTTTGVVSTTASGDGDVFVTKTNFKGSAIVWSTYLGGNSQDNANGITVDIVSGSNSGTNCASGCPIVTGQTFSGNFPTLPFQGTNNMPNLSGTNDAFAAKLNATGTALVYSMFLGGTGNDIGTGVTVDLLGNVFVGGYTDSNYFLCPGGVIPPIGMNQCTNANHNNPNSSSDAFVVKIPASFQATSSFSALQSALYGGFGQEFARAITYNPWNGMVYLAGDTNTAPQNFVAPNNVNLPGITNNTLNQYSVVGVDGKTYNSGLPGPGGSARGGFVVAFDSLTFVRTFASYLAVSPAAGSCPSGLAGTTVPCNTGLEIITGIAAEEGAAATTCVGAPKFTCDPTSVATATIAATYGEAGHIYLTGNTTSHINSSNIAAVVPTWSCVNPLAANSTNATGPNPLSFPITGPTGLPVIFPGGNTFPAGCTTALITQTPFSTNQADVSGCAFPWRPELPPTQHCNSAAFVAIMDSALLTAPTAAGGGAPLIETAACTPSCSPIGNQVEYWAYYSSPNSSTVSNALAIDMNPTTLTSVYSVGPYQQMYITGGSELTGAAGTQNQLPVTNYLGTGVAPGGNEIFLSYNVGTTTGGGVGGFTPKGATAVASQNEIDAFVARFNPNGLAASAFGGQGSGANPNNMGYEIGNAIAPQDHSGLIHTPQFNYGEFLYSQAATETNNGQTPSTVGNAIAVDPTRAVLIGGATNVTQASGTSCPATSGATIGSCQFTTTNFLPSTGGVNNGGTDGWASVLFFNDILTDASSVSTANPFLQPGFPERTPTSGTTKGCEPGGIVDGLCSYIQTTPAPYGPTFDFAISDPSTQTQTFRVIFTGQTAGFCGTFGPGSPQCASVFFVPLDPRTGATAGGTVIGVQAKPTVTGGTNIEYPGSGIAYYIPCAGAPPSIGGTLVDGFTAAPAPSPVPAPVSPGYWNNAYPAPGTPYGPQTCNTPPAPNPNLYEFIPMLYTGYPGLTPAQAGAGNLVTPGWLLVSQDINPGVVRLQLDRRAAAGLLEGTYVAQFLVTTYDPENPNQWPPCGPGPSVANPFVSSPNCTNASTPLPADNVSTLVTVRLIVRPTIFLSRNSGLLTGVTGPLPAQGAAGNSAFALNPLSGPGTGTGADLIYIQDGTGKVPDWWFTGKTNDTSAWPGAGGAPNYGLDNIINSGTPKNANATAVTCIPGPVPGIYFDNNNPIVPPLGNPATAMNNLPVPGGVTVPCGLEPDGKTVAVAPFGATAYSFNGPGDLSDGPIGTAPRMTFLYDLGTVLQICGPGNPTCPTAFPLTACQHQVGDITNGINKYTNAVALPDECNLSIEQNLAPTRPDLTGMGLSDNDGAFANNLEWQGGQDPVPQRNDATIHDYYIEAEGSATLSVAAINCSYWNAGGSTQGQPGHVQAVGNWLAVNINGNPAAPLNGNGSPNPLGFTPICTDLTATSVGTLPAPATITLTPANADDTANPPAIGGKQITLDFLAKAYSGGCTSPPVGPAGGNGVFPCSTTSAGTGSRVAMNGIPTGLYTASVYVWATRAKNSVPGYCLGSDFAVDGGQPTICAPSTTSIASSANPNPEVVVTNQQFFNVSLFVFDTTQTIQITPNSCPTGGITNGVTEFATIGGISENLFTGNITPPYGPGSVPNYPAFGANASQLVEWSLLPFQTTGTNVTGCTGPGGTAPQGTPCPNPLAPNAGSPPGDANGGNNINVVVPLPQGVAVNAQTLQQYNACQLPTGSFNGAAITGQNVPGIGQLVQVGPLSQTTFIPSPNNTNALVTIYACRPTIAPAWLNSGLYPGNAVSAPVAITTAALTAGTPIPAAPEQYSNGNGPFGGPPCTPSPAGVTPATCSGGTSSTTFAFGSAVVGCSNPNDLLASAYPNCAKGVGPVPSTSALTCPLGQGTGCTGPSCIPQTTSRIGVYRPGAAGTLSQAIEDTTGANAYVPGSSRFIANFLTGNFNGITPLPTDIAVAGDWNGDGYSKLGIYRPTTGQWFLDVNNNGIYDAGDFTYSFGGISGDKPVVGDWTGIGKTCIGIFRQGFFWILDLNCNGAFDGVGADTAFPFGGITNDVPVTGNFGLPGEVGWRVGVVRSYAPGGVVGACNATTTVGCPFYWVLDNANANAGTAATTHQPAAGAFPYGGLFGDVFVTGDWTGTGVWHAGIFRTGNWIEDTTGAHTYDTFFQFGGVPGDQPIVGKWNPNLH